METKRVLILSAAVGSGHKTAARSLETAFQRYPNVEVVNQDILAMTNDTYRRLSADVYLEAVKRVPWIVGWTYQYNDEPFKNEEPVRKLWEQLNSQPVVRFLKEYQPHICVCTHYTPAGIVAQLMASDQLDTVLSVVTTDYDFQGMWLSRTFNRYFVARDEAKARLIDFEVDEDRITVSGIPVDQRFGEPLDRAAMLAQYELRDDAPLIVLSAGAVGGGPARALVGQLVKLRHNVQTIVVCGSNAQLRRDIEELTLSQADKFRVLGYTSDMPNLVRAATLFVAKPGGLTASECMAAGTPMIIIAPIPGQEERNSDYLLEEGAALRCNDFETIDFKIDRLLDDPAQLAQLKANAKRIGRPDAADVVAATVLADVNRPVRYNWRSQQRRLRGETSVGDPLALVSPLSTVERVFFGPSETVTLALYDDTTGIYLGSLEPGQYRTLRKHLTQLGDDVATTVVTHDDIERVRLLGFGSDLIDRLERRIRFHGPVTLRRVKVGA